MAAPANANSAVQYVKIQVVGGELPGATLAQRIGPLGLSAKVVGEEIKKATAEYKSIKVRVLLTIKDRKATVEVKPSTSTLIIKALREPPRDRKKEKNITHSGSLKLVEVMEIAQAIRERSYARCFSGSVKEVLGTCLSIGCQVEGKSPKAVIAEINEGQIRLPDQ